MVFVFLTISTLLSPAITVMYIYMYINNHLMHIVCIEHIENSIYLTEI